MVVDMYEEHEVCQLYYDDERNAMTDENGFTVFDIYNYITPSMYFLFLKKKEYMCFETKRGCFVELIWPIDDDDDPPFY